MLTSATNPILSEFRLENGPRSDAYATHEWLFQLARHWALWQSPRIGTFPLDYTDPSGPVDEQTSEETGEDTAYWTICAAIASLPDSWADRIIAHATHVLMRLDSAYMERGDL